MYINICDYSVAFKKYCVENIKLQFVIMYCVENALLPIESFCGNRILQFLIIVFETLYVHFDSSMATFIVLFYWIIVNIYAQVLYKL